MSPKSFLYSNAFQRTPKENKKSAVAPVKTKEQKQSVDKNLYPNDTAPLESEGFFCSDLILWIAT